MAEPAHVDNRPDSSGARLVDRTPRGSYLTGLPN